jgi:SOS-response transcriptional repressor LexA
VPSGAQDTVRAVQTNAEMGVERREQIMRFVTDFWIERGYSPTVREVAVAVGLRSPHTAHTHLLALVKEGRLVRRQVTTHTFVFAVPEAL